MSAVEKIIKLFLITLVAPIFGNSELVSEPMSQPVWICKVMPDLVNGSEVTLQIMTAKEALEKWPGAIDLEDPKIIFNGPKVYKFFDPKFINSFITFECSDPSCNMILNHDPNLGLIFKDSRPTNISFCSSKGILKISQITDKAKESFENAEEIEEKCRITSFREYVEILSSLIHTLVLLFQGPHIFKHVLKFKSNFPFLACLAMSLIVLFSGRIASNIHLRRIVDERRLKLWNKLVIDKKGQPVSFNFKAHKCDPPVLKSIKTLVDLLKLNFSDAYTINKNYGKSKITKSSVIRATNIALTLAVLLGFVLYVSR